MNKEARRTAGAILMVVATISIVTFGLVTCAQAVHKDTQHAKETAIEKTETYGVAIKPWQNTKCLNGWFIVQMGVHAWVYPRDEMGDLIRCE